MTISGKHVGYRAGWQQLTRQREKELETRYEKAIKQVRLAAEHLKQKYNCKVFLFGSLVDKNKYMNHSDIDIAVSGVGIDVNFWQLYSEVMDILHPFDFDLVEMEKIDPEVRDYILDVGLEL